uniref:dihydrofolate reductase n=1 Tax=Cyprinus carpio TaxID=7962 RepID=A0A8C2K2M1_CYPCA
MQLDGGYPWFKFQFFLDTITAVSAPGKYFFFWCTSGKKNLLVWGLVWISCPVTVFPLANCLSLVLSGKMSALPPCAHYLCKDFGSVIHLASEPPLCHIVETIWVLGGPDVYKESLEHPWCDLIYLTDIMAEFDCNVFFPKSDRNVFRKKRGRIILSFIICSYKDNKVTRYSKVLFVNIS